MAVNGMLKEEHISLLSFFFYEKVGKREFESSRKNKTPGKTC
jgi:hypothetical protein